MVKTKMAVLMTSQPTKIMSSCRLSWGLYTQCKIVSLHVNKTEILCSSPFPRCAQAIHFWLRMHFPARVVCEWRSTIMVFIPPPPQFLCLMLSVIARSRNPDITKLRIFSFRLDRKLLWHILPKVIRWVWNSDDHHCLDISNVTETSWCE